MFSELDELDEINILLTTNQNNKKKRLHAKFISDIANLISKNEYMYYKYIIKNKSLSKLSNEHERQIAIVQSSLKTFFPYILAHNVEMISNC